jgi:hypothetical protein
MRRSMLFFQIQQRIFSHVVFILHLFPDILHHSSRVFNLFRVWNPPLGQVIAGWRYSRSTKASLSRESRVAKSDLASNNGPQEAKAQIVVAKIGVVEVTVRGIEEPRIAAPTAATDHAVRALCTIETFPHATSINPKALGSLSSTG